MTCNYYKDLMNEVRFQASSDFGEVWYFYKLTQRQFKSVNVCTKNYLKIILLTCWIKQMRIIVQTFPNEVNENLKYKLPVLTR